MCHHAIVYICVLKANVNEKKNKLIEINKIIEMFIYSTDRLSTSKQTSSTGTHDGGGGGADATSIASEKQV